MAGGGSGGGGPVSSVGSAWILRPSQTGADTTMVSGSVRGLARITNACVRFHFRFVRRLRDPGKKLCTLSSRLRKDRAN